MARIDGRKAAELRPIEIVRGYTRAAPGSVLMRAGDTVVLCTASIEEEVPEWLEGQGRGWVTAEYDMLPASTGRRRPRSRKGPDGRAAEIQRLIGRVLRAVVDFEALGPRTVWLDCDVIQADGGTRTTAITGAYVALCDALGRLQTDGTITRWPVRDAVAAVSVGKVDGRLLLDLNYAEDARAEVDCNVAMTGAGRFVEVQGSAEGGVFSADELDRMLRLAGKGIAELIRLQRRVLSRGTTGRR
ncbi:MAG: ribonuclease PH [Phycisphaerae bacterium]